MRFSRWFVTVLLALTALAAALLLVVPATMEKFVNRTLEQRPPAVGDAARRLHESLFVADLHADSLLWRRDLLARSPVGHVDVPRLVVGGVALQVFSAVTKVPWGLNYDSNRADAADLVTALAIVQRWPRSTWTSLRERALHQARRLHEMAGRSGGRFRVIESAGDLRRFVADRERDPQLTAGLLAIEGLQALEGDAANLEVLRQAGFRMMGVAHFFDNELGGSVHGSERGGLTALGREVVRRMEAHGILVDLAHSSPLVMQDVLAMARRPVVVSHTGVKGTCDHVRNLTDDQLRAVAANGGLIGIGYWDAAVCEVTAGGIVQALLHAARVAGADHVALGSDFDGGTETPFDTSGIPLLTQELLAAGLGERDVRAIMGGNVRRLLAQSLPE